MELGHYHSSFEVCLPPNKMNILYYLVCVIRSDWIFEMVWSMYLFQKIYYSCGIVIILSLCFPSRISKQLVFYYLPCSFYWERPCFKWSVTLDMYIIGEIKTGILFKDFYICTTYRKRQKFELISYCFFCSTCRLSSNSGQKNIHTFCIQSCLLRPTLRCEEKKKDYLFLGGYQKKKLLWQEECTFETFF